jgi:hypothetical protein
LRIAVDGRHSERGHGEIGELAFAARDNPLQIAVDGQQRNAATVSVY